MLCSAILVTNVALRQWGYTGFGKPLLFLILSTRCSSACLLRPMPSLTLKNSLSGRSMLSVMIRERMPALVFGVQIPLRHFPTLITPTELVSG